MAAEISQQESIHLVAVGSTNPVKLAAARSVMETLYPGVRLQGVAVESGVPDQPRSDDETVTGAINRARAARARLNADLGIGLEGGVQASPWGCLLSGWVAIVDRQGRVGLASAGRILLPPALAGAIERGEELGPAMDRLSGQADTRRGPGAVGILTNELVKREEAFRMAVAYAAARFLHPEWYPVSVESNGTT